ncbi:MAG: rod shape-determining protein RodA [Gammaproteobacteria bacterium]|nr:MAG: rod shape-determining protein RodA [Gammaproteobacteria bacterium]
MNQLLRKIHLDGQLLLGILILCILSLIILYSAGGQETSMLTKQGIRIGAGLTVLLFAAQFSPQILRSWTPWIYALGLLLLIAVIFKGVQAKGAQRWLDAGIFLFQPSEIMKLALPLMLARFFSEYRLPPDWPRLIIGAILIGIPFALIIKQPDLGTSLLVGASGFFVIFLAGIRWRILLGLTASGIALLPIAWFFLLHEYQRTRVLTLLDPESDPLGHGWHTIQSKIAIGSGGVYGKGWLNGTQSQLEFLPERHTDFIFAVIGEEFGLTGLLILLTLYLFIVARGLYIAANAQDTFSRLLAGSLSLTFFIYVFVNIGMVIGILPVVGLPLPLISYGGTSIVTLMASFGMIMSIETHKRLFRHDDL